MDNFALKPERKVKRKSPLWNILTVLLLFGLCGMVYFFATIFINPYSRLNPFPPEALPTRYETATYTSTLIPMDSTWTPTFTIQPSPSRTRAPTWTTIPGLNNPKMTDTPASNPDLTATINSTPMPVTSDITYIASTDVHPSLGCNWMGVGGKVLDANGDPLLAQIIQLGGSLNGQPISLMVLSGHDSQAPYGSSGFEFALGNKALDSTQELWIMLSDNVGKPLSTKIYLDTFSDCSKNLLMVIFTKTP